MPKSGHPGQILTNLDQCLGNFGHMQVDFGQIWTGFELQLAEFGQIWADFGHILCVFLTRLGRESYT